MEQTKLAARLLRQIRKAKRQGDLTAVAILEGRLAKLVAL